MRWVLIDLALVLLPLVVLALTGLRLWRLLRRVTREGRDVAARGASLSKLAAELSTSLDTATMTKLSEATGNRGG
jgi:hypothetical protein